SVAELDTPAVVIDLGIVEKNIARVQAMIAAAGLGARPHIKTHKIPRTGRKQIAASAIGITCQKLGEVEAFVGVADDILLTYNIVGAQKLERLMDLIGRVPKLTVVADSDAVVRGLSDAAARHGRDVRFLIECDTGGGRN